MGDFTCIIHRHSFAVFCKGTCLGVPEYLYRSGQHFWWYTTVGYSWTDLQGIPNVLFFVFLCKRFCKCVLNVAF